MCLLKLHAAVKVCRITCAGNFYRPQRSWAKVIFSQACVKNSVHRGGGRVYASVHAGIHPLPPDQADTLPDQADAPGDQTPPGTRQTPPRCRHPPRSRHTPGSRLQHMVNEQPVRILLECIFSLILVFQVSLCRFPHAWI